MAFKLENNRLEEIQSILPTSPSGNSNNIRDLALSHNNKFLYAIDKQQQRILGYKVTTDSRLDNLNITDINITSEPFGMLILD